MKKSLILISVAFISILILQNCKHEIPERTPTDNTGGKDTVPISQSDTCSPDTVYFVNDILPIIISNCAQSGCHDATTKEDGVQLTDYDNIIKTGKVVAGDPNDSELYEVLVETDPKKVMPPPPATLSTEQRNAIRLWILQGAKNNSCENKCDTSSVTFSGNIWPILETTCSGCHKGPNPNGNIRITNYGEAKTLVDNGKLIGVINHRPGFKPMPPGGSVTECAKAQIRIWIDAGAPNN